jgi:hypothetical protein
VDPTWNSIDGQQYPYRFAFCEFTYNDPTTVFIQRYVDFPPYSNVTGLLWRAVPSGWPWNDPDRLSEVVPTPPP